MTSETGFDPELYKRFPTAGPRPEGELEALEKVWASPTGWRRFTDVSNNYIGIWFLGTTFLFFLLAGVLALIMRTQLAVPMNDIVAQATYNQVFTMHGTVMMFLFAVPAVEALAVLLLPQMLRRATCPSRGCPPSPSGPMRSEAWASSARSSSASPPTAAGSCTRR